MFPFLDVSLIPPALASGKLQLWLHFGIYYLHNPYRSSCLAEGPTFSKEGQVFPFLLNVEAQT